MKLSQQARDLMRTGHTITLTPIDYAQEMLYRAKDTQYGDKVAGLEQKLLLFIDSNPTEKFPPMDLTIHMIARHLTMGRSVQYSVNKMNMDQHDRRIRF